MGCSISARRWSKSDRPSSSLWAAPLSFPPSPRLNWTPRRDKACKTRSGNPKHQTGIPDASQHTSQLCSGRRRTVIYFASGASFAGSRQRCSPRPEHAGGGRGKQAPGDPATAAEISSLLPARRLPPGWELAPAHDTSAPSPAWRAPAGADPRAAAHPASQGNPPPLIQATCRLPGPALRALGAARPGAVGQRRQRRPSRHGCGGERAENAERSAASPDPPAAGAPRRAEWRRKYTDWIWRGSGRGRGVAGQAIAAAGVPPRCGEVPGPQARLEPCHAAGRKSPVTAASSPQPPERWGKTQVRLGHCTCVSLTSTWVFLSAKGALKLWNRLCRRC